MYLRPIKMHLALNSIAKGRDEVVGRVLWLGWCHVMLCVMLTCYEDKQDLRGFRCTAGWQSSHRS